MPAPATPPSAPPADTEAPPPLAVLVLCTANSARSILAEALLAHLGAGRVRACSAGSNPRGAVNPWALDHLARRGLPTAGLRSKSWEEFAGPGAPAVDLVITVCDSAAAEPCPVWPGAPATAHWGIPDPAAASGDESAMRVAFARTATLLERRIRALLALPGTTLRDPRALQAAARHIGAEAAAAEAEKEDR